jgi:DNA repair photolyase
VLAEFRNPVVIITKNHLVTRDIDLLSDMAKDDLAIVNVSVTSLDPKLQRVMEPRTSIPSRRLGAVEALAKAGIPVRVMIAPIIPGLTDHEAPAIVQAAADAGARSVSHIMLRLPHGVKDLFVDWIERHYPERAGKVLSKVREMRGGELNDPRFGSRMRGEGETAGQIHALVEAAKKKSGIRDDLPKLSTSAFARPPVAGQLGLFG